MQNNLFWFNSVFWFAIVNLTLSIILIKSIKQKQFIDILFLICVTATFLGNLCIESNTLNLLLSFGNLYLGLMSYGFGFFKKSK